MLCDDCKVQVDERMRLAINVSRNSERLVFSGQGKNWMLPENGKMMNLQNYHVLNEVVIDRGPMT